MVICHALICVEDIHQSLTWQFPRESSC